LIPFPSLYQQNVTLTNYLAISFACVQMRFDIYLKCLSTLCNTITKDQNSLGSHSTWTSWGVFFFSLLFKTWGLPGGFLSFGDSSGKVKVIPWRFTREFAFFKGLTSDSAGESRLGSDYQTYKIKVENMLVYFHQLIMIENRQTIYAYSYL
jgi:hypothetical protein